MQKHLPGNAGCNWGRLCEEAGLPRKTYAPKAAYTDAEAMALFETASRISQRPLSAILEDFGEAIAPDLIALHPTLVRPEWDTLDLLVNTEQLIHAVVRRSNPAAKPPVLHCHR